MLYVGYIGGRCYCIFETIIVHVLFIFNPVCTSLKVTPYFEDNNEKRGRGLLRETFRIMLKNNHHKMNKANIMSSNMIHQKEKEKGN